MRKTTHTAPRHNGGKFTHTASVRRAAFEAHKAGICILRTSEDGQKRPWLPGSDEQWVWGPYQTKRPTDAEMDQWFGPTATPSGLGMVAGDVSGKVDAWDFDCRKSYEDYRIDAREGGLGHVVDRIEAGLCDDTAGGGVRWLVRYPDEIKRKPGERIILARRPDPEIKVKTLIEMPCYSILAPTNGVCHPSGKPYVRRSGGFSTIASYTAEEREALIELARSFDRMPRAEHQPPPQTKKEAATGIRPGDLYAQEMEWAEILEPAGWKRGPTRGPVTYWRRPGKKLGWSATTNFADANMLRVFSTSTEFDDTQSYSKFAAYAVMQHGGNFSKAARALAKQFKGRPELSAKRAKGPPSEPQPSPEPSSSPPVLPVALVANEDAIASAFADRHVDELRYCHDWGAWLRWDGSRWERERRRLAFHYARQLAREANIDEKAAPAKASTAAGVERFAQADPRLATISDTWDRNAWLLATPKGTIDLRTGEVRAAEPLDYLTKRTAIAPAPPGTPTPMWDAFLVEATHNDPELIGYLQRVAGYCLTGDVSEHALFFIHGDGGNGKGVLINTVNKILGDCATTASMDTFTASKSDRHPTDLAMLQGARFVTAQETEEGRAWNEVRIKTLTGGDPITARFMRQDFFTFDPTFKLVIAGNHKPNLRSVDAAARRRINIIPFTNKPRKLDTQLADKLKDEWPGILRWCIDGCLAWQQQGLNPPPVVRSATDAYFDEQDVFTRWLEECCEPGSGRSETHAALFKSWKDWADSNGEAPGSSKDFTSRLLKANPTLVSIKHTPGQLSKRGFKGVRLKPKDTSNQWPNQHERQH